YQMVFQTDLILVYGASGTGKTSLIQCGLASKFQTYEWLALSIRRGENLNESLEKALAAYDDPETPSSDDLDWLTDTGETPAQATESPAARRLKNLYLRHFKPVFLIFDQFEELYILGTKAEQNQFVDTVREILRIEQPVKVLISIREEYLGYLYEFERKVPELLRKKLRIEPMNLEKVQTVVQGISRLPYSNVHLQQGAEAAIGEGIFEKLKERENVLSIELPYLQVFLDKLYLQITGDRSRQSAATITVSELQKMGDIGDVLRNFLDDQVQENARALGVPPDTIKKLLSPFVTLDGTKEPLSADQLHARLPELDTPFIARSLQAFQNSRILRFDEKEQRYEVAHDSLARQIATYQDAEDIALQKAAQMIRTQMLLDADRREVFSEKQLLFMEPYLPKLELSGEEQGWIEGSRAYWKQMRDEEARKEREALEKEAARIAEEKAEAERRRKRALMTSLVATVLVLGAVAATFFAFVKSSEAEKEAQNAREAIDLADEKTRQSENSDSLALIEKAIAQEATNRATLAQQIADEKEKIAREAEERAQAAIRQSGIDSENAKNAKKEAEEKRLEAEEATRIAQAIKVEAQTLTLQVVTNLLLQIRRDILLLDYQAAFTKVKNAASLNALKDSLAYESMEIAYFHHHSGHDDLAREPYDLAAVLLGKNALKGRMDFEKLDPDKTQLLKVRYFGEMVALKGGSFQMQAKKFGGEVYEYEASVADFQLSKYETTVWQYNLFCIANGRNITQRVSNDGNTIEEEKYQPSWGWVGNNPVVYVSWYDAVTYANWLSVTMGKKPAYVISAERDSLNENEYDDFKWTITPVPQANGFRLPTELEWEFAARGGLRRDSFEYSGSNTLDSVAWYSGNSDNHTQPVGAKNVNGAGIFDMSGNVWEWCYDWYGDLPAENAFGAKTGTDRVVRGGSWGSHPEYCRVADRYGYHPDFRNDYIGFRLVFVP
ncbi:MAG: SUMF1/EgtB/PvdO family nonheme iron enzyme, partial [Saprospiraceae bacterium]|nr:SUMF1/EgtB/PvdO family nonheme iron enzyme [Saprospiraceae bacterium]